MTEANHVCDTTHPTRACCWERRRSELEKMIASDTSEDAMIRTASGGHLSCLACGHRYDDAPDVADHARPGYCSGDW